MRPIPAGIALATMAMVLFGVYHWFFVAPVVAVFLEGVLWAAGGGALIGWAYQQGFIDRGRHGPLWGLAFGALFASTLVPSEIVGLVWGPFDITEPGDVPKALPLAFLGVPLAVLLAWLLAGRKSIVWPFVLAVTVVHFILGGSIANFGGRGTTALLFGGFVVLELLGGAWLGWVVSPTGHKGAPQERGATARDGSDPSDRHPDAATARERPERALD